MPLPARVALLVGKRCRLQRSWGSSSLPLYQKARPPHRARLLLKLPPRARLAGLGRVALPLRLGLRGARREAAAGVGSAAVRAGQSAPQAEQSRRRWAHGRRELERRGSGRRPRPGQGPRAKPPTLAAVSPAISAAEVVACCSSALLAAPSPACGKGGGGRQGSQPEHCAHCPLSHMSAQPAPHRAQHSCAPKCMAAAGRTAPAHAHHPRFQPLPHAGRLPCPAPAPHPRPAPQDPPAASQSPRPAPRAPPWPAPPAAPHRHWPRPAPPLSWPAGARERGQRRA